MFGSGCNNTCDSKQDCSIAGKGVPSDGFSTDSTGLLRFRYLRNLARPVVHRVNPHYRLYARRHARENRQESGKESPQESIGLCVT